jgi:hypothetical protein
LLRPLHSLHLLSLPCQPLALLPDGCPVPLGRLDLALQVCEETRRLLVLVLLLPPELVSLPDLPGERVQVLEVLRVVTKDDMLDMVSSLALELDLWVELEDLGDQAVYHHILLLGC